MTHTMRNLGLGAGAVLIALGTVAAVHASPQNTNPPPRPFMGRMGRMGGPGGGPLGRWGMLASRLGLSDTQRSQIKGILQAHGDELRGLGDKAMAAREALDDAIDSGTVDEAAIRARSAEVAAVEADMAVDAGADRSAGVPGADARPAGAGQDAPGAEEGAHGADAAAHAAAPREEVRRRVRPGG